jgi:hypothetical protein
MKAIMGKTARQVQQVAPLNPNVNRVEKTSKADRNHTDKGRPFELIRTGENYGRDIGEDLKQVLQCSFS